MISKLRILIAIIGILLFSSIGLTWMHTYSLWDDEANTALFAQSVHATGDTSAILDHNQIAYRNGSELNGSFKSRYVSPLQYFFLAPWIGSPHPTPFQARFPFFILTFLSLLLVYRRLILLEFSVPMMLAWLSLSVGLTPLLLFGIQSRYYALTFFFTLLLVDQYWFSKMEKRSQFLRFGIVSSLLFISNYLIGVAVIATIGFHHLFKKKKLKNYWIALVPHLFLSVPVFLIWNPIGKKVVEMKNSPLDKLNLLYRNIRDFNGGELGSLLILMMGMAFFDSSSKKRFREYGLLFLVYLSCISLFSPQPVHGTGMADIRYLYPLMILSIVWSLDFFKILLSRNRIIFAIVVAVFSFSSLPYNGQLRTHFLELLQELHKPAEDPYQLVSNELNRIEIPSSEHPTIISSLDYATYPLMFLSPQYQYLGQLESQSSIVPEYVVSFCNDGVLKDLENQFHVRYQLLKSFHTTCREAFRPEVFLRSFGKDQDFGSVSVFKKM